MTGFFSSLAAAPKDPILDRAAECNADKTEDKVDLIVGAYRTEEKKPYVFPVVAELEKQIQSEPEYNHEYVNMDGYRPVFPLVQKLILGSDLTSSKELLSKLATCQTLSGTGAVRMAGELVKLANPKCRIFISDPSWANHRQIFEETLGFETLCYPYWNEKKMGADIPAMVEFLEKTANPHDCIVLHAVAHNPTGSDPTDQEWQTILDLVKRKNLLPLFDCAYQGFATGDLEKDAFSMRLFASSNISEMMITQSFAKNLGMYGERLGFCHVLCQNKEQAVLVNARQQRIARCSYSSPPRYGAIILYRLLSDEKKIAAWKSQLKEVTVRLAMQRTNLRQKLLELKVPNSNEWAHLTEQKGMFSFSGLDKEQCLQLSEKYHVFLTTNGRMSLAGLNGSNIDKVAEAIRDVAV